MIKITKKPKSFTLIELVVGVSIFATIAVLGMAIFSMSMGSKSKIAGLNVLREDGNRIMVEIGEMVGKGNSNIQGSRGILFRNGSNPVSSCTVNPGDANRLHTLYKNANGHRLQTRLVVGSNKVSLRKYYDGVPLGPLTKLNSDKVEISNFELSGYQRRGSCDRAVQVTVKFTITSKDTAVTGEVPSLTLMSTFTPGYPNPDQAGDSG